MSGLDCLCVRREDGGEGAPGLFVKANRRRLGSSHPLCTGLQKSMQQGTPTAATPVPQPSLAPPPLVPPPSNGTRVVDLNPTADAANALAQATALVDQVERDLLALLDRCQAAYTDADVAPAPGRCPASPPDKSYSSQLTPNDDDADSTTLLNSLSSLISLLSRSALGGFVPPPSPAAAAAASTTLSQAQLDQVSERSQTLFKQLQAVRERAEVVRAGLARS